VLLGHFCVNFKSKGSFGIRRTSSFQRAQACQIWRQKKLRQNVYFKLLHNYQKGVWIGHFWVKFKTEGVFGIRRTSSLRRAQPGVIRRQKMFIQKYVVVVAEVVVDGNT
jgi:hypothetical protein